MKRRSFIILGSAGVAALSIPAAFYFFDDIEYDPILAEPRSLSMIWDTETIKAVGDQYRLQIPSEKSEMSLIKLLKAAAPELEDIIKKDFETGNTVIIDGWILSTTEARQCALFSITGPK